MAHPLVMWDVTGLERQPCADLEFTAGCRRLRYGSELRRVNEAVRRTEVGVIQGIEGLSTELKACRLANRKGTHQSQIKCLDTWSVDGVSSDIAIGERGRGGEGGRIE